MPGDQDFPKRLIPITEREAGGEEVQEHQRADNLMFCLDEVAGDIKGLSEIVEGMRNIKGEDKMDMRRDKLRDISPEDVRRIVNWLSLFEKASRSREVDPELAQAIKEFR